MKKILMSILIISVILIACAPTKPKTSESEAVEVVRTYFEAWDGQDWLTMYSLMSDGFKKIDPNAKTLQDFEAFASRQGITSVRINSITEKLNDGTSATIDYDVTFTIKGKETPFKSTFTIRYKPDDAAPGWKLIHPYGPNIDTT